MPKLSWVNYSLVKLTWHCSTCWNRANHVWATSIKWCKERSCTSNKTNFIAYTLNCMIRLIEITVASNCKFVLLGSTGFSPRSMFYLDNWSYPIRAYKVQRNVEIYPRPVDRFLCCFLVEIKVFIHRWSRSVPFKQPQFHLDAKQLYHYKNTIKLHTCYIHSDNCKSIVANKLEGMRASSLVSLLQEATCSKLTTLSALFFDRHKEKIKTRHF